jgi:hypothetical protein
VGGNLAFTLPHLNLIFTLKIKEKSKFISLSAKQLTLVDSGFHQ